MAQLSFRGQARRRAELAELAGWRALGLAERDERAELDLAHLHRKSCARERAKTRARAATGA